VSKGELILYVGPNQVFFFIHQTPHAWTKWATAKLNRHVSFDCLQRLIDLVCIRHCMHGQRGPLSCIGLARTVYIHAVYDRMFIKIPAKNTVYTPYMINYGQPSCLTGMCSTANSLEFDSFLTSCFICTRHRQTAWNSTVY
jgi:hypothetical protein